MSGWLDGSPAYDGIKQIHLYLLFFAYMDVGKGREQDAEALPTWMARIVPDNCFAFPPFMAVIVRGESIRAGRP